MNLDDKEDLRLQIITDMIGYLDLSIKFDPTADLVEKPNDLKTEVFDVISVNKRSFSAAPIWEETEPINIHCPRVLIELLKKGDTFFIISRNIRYGILSASAFYDPPRPRIVFPIINSDTLYYTGTESITGLKRKVESYVFSITDSNKTSIIKNVTVRGESTDEYEIHIDSTGLINYISMDLPVFSMFCKIMGLRSNQLEFVPYEEY